MLAAQIIFYALVGFPVGLVAKLFLLDDAQWCPPGSEPALAFLAWLLWPVTLAVAAACFLLRLGISVAGGFVALWRHRQRVRARRVAAGRRAS